MIDATNLEKVKEYLQQNKQDIMQKYQANGVGIGKEKLTDAGYVIVVYLQDKQYLPDIPVILDGIPIQFEITGHFNLQT